MSLLEQCDLTHIKPKVAARVIHSLLTCYISQSQPTFSSSFLGKITSREFNGLKDATFTALDNLGTGQMKDVAGVFGELVEDDIKSSIREIKKVALSRTIFSGKRHLIDYNWSLKMIQSSDSIANAPSYLVQVELILGDGKGREDNTLLEFGEDEFAEFVSRLETLVLGKDN